MTVVKVPSKTTAGRFYNVTIGLDGALQCECVASFYPYRGECWHVKWIREELEMTTETTSRALVPVTVKPPVALLPTERELDIVRQTAEMVFAGAVSLPQELNTPAKVAAIMLYGLELGLRPMTAIQGLYIVKGKVSASAQIMMGLCMQREPDIEFHTEQHDESICTIRFVRPRRNVNQTYTTTWAMIKTAGLATGANVQYPMDRLAYHTVKRLCRLYAPDLINGLDEGVSVAGLSPEPQWTPSVDDLYNDGDVPENVDRETGEITDGEWQDTGAPNAPSEPTATSESAPARQTGPSEHEATAATESEVGEPAEPPPSPATRDQLATIKDWSDMIKESTTGAAKLKALEATRREWFGADGVDPATNRWSSARLSVDQAEAYIALLKETHESKPAPQQAALAT